MKDFLKKNYAVVLAFALPIVLIAGVALTTYLPSLFLSTDYDFVYATCTDGLDRYSNYCHPSFQNRFSVVNGAIVENIVDPTLDSDRDGIPDVDEGYKMHFILHDTTTNESKEITLEEAKALNLSELLTSPDGVTVSGEYDRGADFLFFGGGSSYGYYLTKGNSRTRLNLINDNDRWYYYRDNFKFVGWVLPAKR